MNMVDEKLFKKPIWIWWIVYTGFIGALFGIFCILFYLLGIMTFIGILVLIALGIIWGTVKYFLQKRGYSHNETIQKPEGTGIVDS